MAPALSIVVPVLNEVAVLPSLFITLGRQREVDFELLLCDGDSSDGTRRLAGELSRAAPFPCTLIGGERGRGRQLNAGAAAAAGDTLLFLHADSRFDDPLSLRKGMVDLAAAMARRGDVRVAGRFALRFDRPAERPAFPYYFYESKARLDRRGCIHGDQGFLLRREFFAALGTFAEDLGYLEDDRLAAAVRQQGEWLLLPAEIHTSARRFETEGLKERQLLNAFIQNFAAIGWLDLLQALPELYRRQDRTRRLDPGPFFREIRRRLDALPRRRRLVLWYRTGGFVRANAWQLAFLGRTWRNYRLGLPPDAGATRFLRNFDRWFDLVTDHPPGRLVTAVLVRVWFQLALLAASRPSASQPQQQPEEEGDRV